MIRKTPIGRTHLYIIHTINMVHMLIIQEILQEALNNTPETLASKAREAVFAYTLEGSPSVVVSAE